MIDDVNVISTEVRSGIFLQHPDDTSFETAKGSPAVDGDIYWNTLIKSPVRHDSVFHSISSIRSITLTVGSGKNFSTIQGALDFIKNIHVFSVIVQVDPGTYSESLDFSDIRGFVSIEGDTRVLAGISYIDGVDVDSNAAGSGEGQVSIVNSANNVIVVGNTTNPDFTGWVSGDKVLIKGNDEVIYERTIDSVSGNTITLTTTAPTISDHGSAITIVPNVRISAETVVNNRFLTVKFYGIEFYSSGISLTIDNSSVAVTRTVVYSTGTRACVVDRGGRIHAHGGEVAFVLSISADSGWCLFVSNKSIALVNYVKFLTSSVAGYSGQVSGVMSIFGSRVSGYKMVVSGTTRHTNNQGFAAQRGSSVSISSALVSRLYYCYFASFNSNIAGSNSSFYYSYYGYVSTQNSTMQVLGSTYVGCYTSPYSPSSFGVEGNNGAWIFNG